MTRRAKILGIDPGTRRIGVAIADLETRFAHALDVIDASSSPVARINDLVEEHGVVKIVVGKPIGLSGRDGPAVEIQKAFVDKLRTGTGVPVEEFDERLTTVVAETSLRAAGTSAKKRKATRDAVAAQVLLQGFLDSTR